MMIRFQPDAESEILAAASILRVRVESFQASDFHPISMRFQQREVTLHLVLERVLKGEIHGQAGERLSVAVTQTENIGLRFTAVPGAYSRIDFVAGLELVVFSRVDETSAAEALADSVCFLVQDAMQAARDVEYAAEAGSPELRLATLMDRLQDYRATFGVLFARYLTDRLPEAFSDDERDLVAVLRILEAPEITTPTRFVLCEGAVGKVLLHSPIAPELLRVFVQTLFRLLLLPEAADLHLNLASTWIPNLVGIEGALGQLSSPDIFMSASLRREVASALEQMSGATAPLLAWFAS